MLAAGAAVLILPLRALGGLPWYLALFALADNLLVFTIGALLPLGFTDGSTILHWLRQRTSGARVSLRALET
jgi:hypothetical protein